MNDKMQVLFATQTGHVLGAFTRTADPETKLKVSDVIGGGLLVRQPRKVTITPTAIEEMVLPAEALELSVVDFDSAVFSSPRAYVVGGGVIAKLGPNTINLGADADPLPDPEGPPDFANPPEVRFSTTQVTVQIGADAAEEKGVCIILEERAPLPGTVPERRVAQGKIAVGKHYIALDWKTSADGSAVSVPSRSFYILVMLAGFQPFFGLITPQERIIAP